MRSYRRRQQIRKTQLTVVLTVISVILLIILFSRMISTTIIGSEPVSKDYYSYEVETGETIWTIAEQFVNDEVHEISDYVQEIITANELTSNKIKSGDQLLIPVYVLGD